MNVLAGQAFQIAKVMAAFIAPFCFGACSSEDTPGRSEHPAVVCTSEGGGPWVLRASGTLTRIRTENELIHRLDLKEKSYEWVLFTNVDKNSTTTHHFLIGDLVEMPKRERTLPFPRGPINAADTTPYPPFPTQSVQLNGEIREDLGPLRLRVVSGTKCPSI